VYRIRIRLGYVSETIILIRILLCPDTGIHTAGPALDTAQGRGGGALRSGRQGGEAEGERGGRAGAEREEAGAGAERRRPVAAKVKARSSSATA
jgi:hypothetical protein